MPEIELIEMDERLNAHINADAFLFGSGLQGDQFCRTIGWLNQYMSRFQEKDIPNSVKRLIQSCSKLVEYEAEIEGLISETDITILSEKIHEDIKLLNKGEYLLMPGGWKSHKSGHAMVYEYRVDYEENLLFIIHNSGSGLNFH